MLTNGELRGVYRKHYLPNYGVFDEHRYFAAGRELVLLRCGDVLIGPTICEDIWQPGPPATDLSLAGAQLIVNLSASPFHVGKAEDREEMLVTRARDNASYLAFCNLVGGQDELVFDGHSVVLDDEGEVIARAPGFEEALLIVDLDPTEVIGRRLRDVRRRELERSRDEVPAATVIDLPEPGTPAEAVGHVVTPFAPELEQMRLALGLGVRDYVEKSGFREVVVAVSGGIDSALTVAICADALGAERVHGVSMPSRFSSEDTQDDAREVAANLGIDFREIPIEEVVGSFTAALAPSFAGREPDLTEENLQARARGVLLMALSNKFGWLVVSTGNKSEMAVGYATLYGDMVGRLRAAQGRVQDRRLPALPPPQRAGRARVDPGDDDRAAAERRAAGRAARRPVAAALRAARPGARGVRRARPLPRGAARRVRPGDGGEGAGARRPGRVQAPPGTARRQAAAPRIRPRLAAADRQALARLTTQSVSCNLR